MKKRTGLLIAVKLIFVLSLFMLLYSVVQVIKAPIAAQNALNEWSKKREEASARTLPREEAPLPEGMVSSFKQNSSSAPAYTEGEIIGEITFPSLNKKVAIVEGTEKRQLKKGAGHYKGSAALGGIGNSVLAGHRDTVFRSLGELKKNDLIEVESTHGKFIYKVIGSSIVDGNERGAIKASSEPILTLITCYPFAYVGSAPERYLLTAELVGGDETLPGS